MSWAGQSTTLDSTLLALCRATAPSSVVNCCQQQSITSLPSPTFILPSPLLPDLFPGIKHCSFMSMKATSNVSRYPGLPPCQQIPPIHQHQDHSSAVEGFQGLSICPRKPIIGLSGNPTILLLESPYSLVRSYVRDKISAHTAWVPEGRSQEARRASN